MRGSRNVLKIPNFTDEQEDLLAEQMQAGRHRSSSTSLRELWSVVSRRWRFAVSVIGSLLLACLLYCVLAPNEYEASAKVALRVTPATTLSVTGTDATVPGGLASGLMQLETLVNIFRSDQLAWRVIKSEKLYQSSAFMGKFHDKFPEFRPDAPDVDAQSYLIERFQRLLTVQTLPRTLIVQLRFRSRDPVVSAAVLNALIRSYSESDRESRVQATAEAAGWLNTQLMQLKSQIDKSDRKLYAFQKQHGILNAPETLADGRPGEAQHTAAFLEVDQLDRELVNASADRVLREAEYRAAAAGDPESVLAADARLQGGTGAFASALLQQLHSHRSELEQEQALLRIEHGPNFPRVVEIQNQLQDIDIQLKAEDAKLLERFRNAMRTAMDREQLMRRSLKQSAREGMKLNQSASEYDSMRQEANASHALYVRVLEKAEEAGLAAGIHNSDISVVDYARPPMKPVAPDPLLYFAITLFAGLWMAVGGAFVLESFRPSIRRAASLLVLFLAAAAMINAQAPTPSTSGLPTGVARIPQSSEIRGHPNPKTAPVIWTGTGAPGRTAPASNSPGGAATMPAPIGPGDSLEVGEAHSGESRASVRVSNAGTVTLALAGEVQVAGMDEQAAAHAIEAALIGRGMLLHPQVTVLVTAYAGQDVSILGEVGRPGVYAYTVHHRLLDLISAASGVGANSGRLVTIIHRDDPKTVLPVALDPNGTDSTLDHNPELLPGDTVQVSRAGLVYVVGDVVRPGGFPVDPVQGISVVQALSLAWGPGQNASLSKALLIREQAGGRTLTTLNLKRMLRGLDPDQPIHDRDILFVPDSMAKNLWNRTMESVIQSAAGVSIYAGLVYSQRF